MSNVRVCQNFIFIFFGWGEIKCLLSSKFHFLRNRPALARAALLWVSTRATWISFPDWISKSGGRRDGKERWAGKNFFKFIFSLILIDPKLRAPQPPFCLSIDRYYISPCPFFYPPISSLCVQSVETGRKRKRTKTFWWWTLALYIRHCSFDIDFLGWKHAGSVASSPIYREEECWRATFFLR
jgi:hypothetical protein